MKYRRALVDFLSTSFSVEGLKALASELDGAEDVCAEMAWDRAVRVVASDLVEKLGQHGLIDAAFVAQLLEKRPRKATEIAKLANMIGDAPKRKESAEEPAAPVVRPPRVAWMVPYDSKGAGLIGREAALEQARERLVERAGPLGRAVVFLGGVGGLGKTQLAVEYAHEWRDSYPGGVFWLTMDQELAPQLQAIADAGGWAHPQADATSKIAEAKHQLPIVEDALIVLDNVEAFASVRALFPKKAKAHLVLTSRDPLAIETVSVPPLSPEDAWRMLATESKRPLGPAPIEAWETKLVAQLDGLPLAIELAGGYLRFYPAMALRHYAELLDASGVDAAVLSDKRVPLASATEHDPNLRRALRVSKVLLADQPELREVLEVYAWSGGAAMGTGLLAWILERDELSLATVLAMGERLQLLRKESDTRYRVHRLLQQVLRDELPVPDEVLARRARRVAEWFRARRVDFRDLPAFEAELDHLETWQRTAEARGWGWEAVVMLWLQGYPAYHWGRIPEAGYLVRLALAHFERFGVNDPEVEAWLCSDLAACIDLDELEAATSCQQRSLAAMERTHELPTGDIVILLCGASLTASSRGAHQEAQAHARAAVDTAESFEADALTRGRAAVALAHALREGGDARGAALHAVRAVAVLGAAVGAEHPNTLDAEWELGLAQRELREWEAAHKRLANVREVRRRAHGRDLHRIAETEFSIGGLELEWARALPRSAHALRVEHLERAVEAFMAAMQGRVGVESARSSSVASVRSWLADALWDLGMATAKHQHFQAAVDVVEQALRDCPPTARAHAALTHLRDQFRRSKKPVRFSTL